MHLLTSVSHITFNGNDCQKFIRALCEVCLVTIGFY